MATTGVIETTNLSEFTWLPVEEIMHAHRSANAASIKTPHKGTVVIEYDKALLKRDLFSTTELGRGSKGAIDILQEIKNLENGANRFLRAKWLKELE